MSPSKSLFNSASLHVINTKQIKKQLQKAPYSTKTLFFEVDLGLIAFPTSLPSKEPNLEGTHEFQILITYFQNNI